MTRIPPSRLTAVSLALLSLALLVFAVINFQQRSRYQLPDDGVSWVDSSEGVKAWIVTPNGPGERAGIREGDRLETINGKAIQHGTDAVQEVFRNGVWSQATYELLRQGVKFQTQLVLVPQNPEKHLGHYLELVGLLYLFIGTYILFRRWTAPRSLHFYIFCLASFVVYSFSYTGKLNLFDWTIYWLNVAALLLQPALFLHFCLTFPERVGFIRERRYVLPLLYVPAALLGAVQVLVASDILILPYPLLQVRWLLDRIGMVYLAAYFLAGAVALQYAYARVRVPLLRQQLKWLTRGTWLAIVPFSALYAVPFFLGFVPNPAMNLSALSLALLPITFGYAIVHYRLMDVDIIFRRGIAYTLATASIVGLYLASSPCLPTCSAAPC